MSPIFNWKPAKYDAGFRAEMPDNITLCVSPYNVKWGKPKRGTPWNASASHWDEATRTMSGYGRDEYRVQYKTAKDAMRAAEAIYNDANSSN